MSNIYVPIELRPSRSDKRQGKTKEDERILNLIHRIATSINCKFPQKTVREYEQEIRRSYMKNGVPLDAKRIAKNMLLKARLNTIPKWYGKIIYIIYYNVKYWFYHPTTS